MASRSYEEGDADVYPVLVSTPGGSTGSDASKQGYFRQGYFSRCYRARSRLGVVVVQRLELVVDLSV